MQRNYDTTGNKTYPRITDINIKYSTSGSLEVTYIEQLAIVDGDGNVHHLDNGSVKYTLDLEVLTEEIPLVSPETGEVIEGEFCTINELFLNILAVIRADQLSRDNK